MVDDHWLSVVVSVAPAGDVLVVRLVGELDLAGASTLAAMTEILADRLTIRRVVIDLAELSLLDCAGGRALCALERALTDAGATIVIEGARPSVARVLVLVDPSAPVAEAG